MIIASFLYGVFQVPLGQFTSVTYPTVGKRLNKNRMRMRALLYEIQDVVDVVNNRKKNLCGYLRDQILQTDLKKSSECYS